MGIVPFAIVEASRQRTRSAGVTVVLLVVPVIVAGLAVASGTGEVSAQLETKAARRTAAAKQAGIPGPSGAFSNIRESRQIQEGPAQPSERDGSQSMSIYLPGRGFAWSSDEGDFATTMKHRFDPVAANPSYITRYPLAIAGLVLSCFLLVFVRRDRSARFLAATTFSILLLTFVPGPAALSARVLTWKLVYRLSWMLPWGSVIAFFVSRIRLRWLPSWLMILLVALAIARGNPANYVKSLREWKPMLRPQPETTEVLRFLAAQPSPQGVILASPGMSAMIPAFVADAYPAAYRGEGTVTRSRLEAILATPVLTQKVIDEIRQARCSYLLVETTSPLSVALGRAGPDFRLIHENTRYQLWRVASR